MRYVRKPDDQFNKSYAIVVRFCRFFLILGAIVTAMNAQRPV